MQADTSFKRFFIRNSYLLVTAAWLITISFIIDNYWAGNSSTEAVRKNITSYIKEQENDFDKLAADTANLERIVSKKYSEANLQSLMNKKYYYFIYWQNDVGQYNLLFWNTQIIQPGVALIAMQGKGGFMQLSNGYYVWRKSKMKGYTSVALIPVKWNYSIDNEYLKNSFVVGSGLENSYDITLNENGKNVVSKDGNFLFSLEQKTISNITENNFFAVILRLLAAVLLFVFIHFTAIYLLQKRFLYSVIFIVCSVIILRVLSYYFPIPLNFRQFELFDPAVYGSSFILRSLGDLLINSVLFLWVFLFIRHHIQERHIGFHVKNKLVQWVIAVLLVFVFLICTILSGHIIKSMVADSQISFDVINFFTLNAYSVVGFVVLGSVAMGYFFFTQIMIYLIGPFLPKNIFILPLISTIIGLIFLTLKINDPDVAFELMIVVWLVIYLMLVSWNYLNLISSKIVSSRLVFWLFFFSVSITCIIVIENNKKEIEKRKHYAETLAAKADPSSERLLNTVLTDFRSESLGPLFYRFKEEASNKSLKDSLVNENFTGYLNKYDTRIYTYDDAEQPLFNQDSTTYNTFSTIIKTQAKPTSIPDLYYFDIAYDRFSYIGRRNIDDTTGNILGHVIIIATPKKYKTDALYPELFLRDYNSSIENSPIYSYAVYNKLQLVNSHNDYAFSSQLTPQQLPKTEFETTTKDGYDELWYKAGADKIVIIAKEDKLFIESITLFSYLFCSFLFISGFFWLLNAIIRSQLRWKELRSYWQMSIRNQVHGTIILISLLSFIIIGVATILFFINRYHSNNREKLSRIIHVMENEVRNSLKDLSAFDDTSNVYGQDHNSKLEDMISRVSEIHAVDVNLYDLDGNLKVSSLPLPYNKGIISSKINPIAYYHLNELKEIQFFKEETIGSLEYLSNYVPVIDESGREYAYLNIPYFTSQTKLRQEISNFLVAIINLNAFIFLISGVVALFLTNRITRSFSFISNRMKAVNIGKLNEAIEWKRNDEIGELVIEYNKMVAKLDDSVHALAKSEREGAWREMARQVAHEIKNPLTPMKLSLQYLQKSISNNSENVHELSSSVVKTLVEQIDHLSQIAGQFSQFANIGISKNEIFDLNESLQQITHLHSVEDNVQVDWKPVYEPVKILADKTHINRLFTNLIQNALQAVPENRMPHIVVAEEIRYNKILVTVTDNGTGIPKELHSSIFIPNFTTKTSGTGLGLAMCKGIVEQSHGDIWFETKEGVGTTFFVELPLVSEEN